MAMPINYRPEKHRHPGGNLFPTDKNFTTEVANPHLLVGQGICSH